jgi:hypothetical protein
VYASPPLFAPGPSHGREYRRAAKLAAPRRRFERMDRETGQDFLRVAEKLKEWRLTG